MPQPRSPSRPHSGWQRCRCLSRHRHAEVLQQNESDDSEIAVVIEDRLQRMQNAGKVSSGDCLEHAAEESRRWGAFAPE
jgi:hypothetical protein